MQGPTHTHTPNEMDLEKKTEGRKKRITVDPLSPSFVRPYLTTNRYLWLEGKVKIFPKLYYRLRLDEKTRSIDFNKEDFSTLQYRKDEEETCAHITFLGTQCYFVS